MASAHVSPDKPDNCAKSFTHDDNQVIFLFTASPPPPKLFSIALYKILGAFGRRSLNLEPADLNRKELICEESELYSALKWRLRLSLLSTSHTHTQTVVCVCGFKLKKYHPVSISSSSCSVFCHVFIFSNVDMPVFKVND